MESILKIRDKNGNIIPIPVLQGKEGKSAYQVWLNEGNTGTVLDFLASLKGERGEKGNTGPIPVRGIDYWNSSDIKGIQDETNSFIVREVAKYEQLKPDFANNTDECLDTTKLYVLPDGYIYAYMMTTKYPEVAITGNIGGYWYNSNGVASYYTPGEGEPVSSKETNYIPVNTGDQLSVTLRCSSGHEANGEMYDVNKNPIGLITFTGTEHETTTNTVTIPSGVAYVRFFSHTYSVSYEDTSLSVVWLVCAGAKSYRFSSTGHKFVPADYEEDIINLTNRVVILESGLDTAFKNKKIIYDGDSVCSSWGDSNGGSYPKIISDITGCSYDNQGVGGGVFRTDPTRHSIVDNLTNLPTDGDLYCFEGGLNDHWSDTPLGDFNESDYTGSVDTSTFCGAVEQVCRYAVDNFVGKPVCFVITHKCPYSAFSQNTLGLTFADYREKMVGILEKYSIPYYDAFMKSGLNGMNPVHQDNFFIIDEETGIGDGTHPNAEGYKKYYVPQLIDLFKKILPN